MLALILLLVLLRQAGPRDQLRFVSILLVISGALGNLYDRLRWDRGVVDFIGTHRSRRHALADLQRRGHGDLVRCRPTRHLVLAGGEEGWVRCGVGWRPRHLTQRTPRRRTAIPPRLRSPVSEMGLPGSRPMQTRGAPGRSDQSFRCSCRSKWETWSLNLSASASLVSMSFLWTSRSERVLEELASPGHVNGPRRDHVEAMRCPFPQARPG